MAESLLHGLYTRILDVQALCLVVLLSWRFREVRRLGGGPAGADPAGPDRAWTPDRFFVACLGAVGVACLAAMTRASLPHAPQVYYDEFWYLATARHIAAGGDASPMITCGLEGQVAPGLEFRPPYPQGWPWLMSWVLRAVPPADTSFAVAVTVERVAGVLAPLALFAMLCGESLLAAGYAAGALAVLPAFVRLSTGASPEGLSLLFIVGFLWAARSVRHAPGPAGALLVVAAGAWAGHFRPENLLYLLLFLPVAFGPRLGRPSLESMGGAWGRLVADRPRLVYGALCLWLVSWIWPDLTIMASGTQGSRSAEHFMAIPRPGFESMAENAWANLRENLAFFVNGRVLPIWVTPLALLGTWILWRRGGRVALLFYWGWIALFTLALSPLPFGDFSAAFSLDTWRFSLHVSLPLILLGAKGLEWSGRALPSTVRPVIPLVVAAVFLTTTQDQGFVQRPHRLQPLWQALVEMRAHLPRQCVVLVDDPSLAVTLREGLGMDAVLGPLPPQVSLQGTPARPLFLVDASGTVPQQWASSPLRVEWISSPPPPSQAPGGTPPARVIVYAWQN